MFTVDNLRITDTDTLFQVSADITHQGKRYLVSGVQWKLPDTLNTHETMVFAYDPNGNIDWIERYCERNTTDVLAVFYRYTRTQ